MQTKEQIIADIKREMIVQGISLKELASDLGMTQQNLSNIFNNGNPTLSSLIKICNHLHLRISIIEDDEN